MGLCLSLHRLSRIGTYYLLYIRSIGNWGAKMAGWIYLLVTGLYASLMSAIIGLLVYYLRKGRRVLRSYAELA